MVSQSELANAEVVVRSSGNVNYVGMTNTDATGNFTLNGVPSGGISVTVSRKGKVIANGAGVFSGGPLTASGLLQIQLYAPVPPK